MSISKIAKTTGLPYETVLDFFLDAQEAGIGNAGALAVAAHNANACAARRSVI